MNNGKSYRRFTPAWIMVWILVVAIDGVMATNLISKAIRNASSSEDQRHAIAVFYAAGEPKVTVWKEVDGIITLDWSNKDPNTWNGDCMRIDGWPGTQGEIVRDIDDIVFHGRPLVAWSAYLRCGGDPHERPAYNKPRKYVERLVTSIPRHNSDDEGRPTTPR